MGGYLITTRCDCACHDHHAWRGCAAECFCAPCAYCMEPIRLIFLRAHQEACRELERQNARGDILAEPGDEFFQIQ